MGIFLDETTTTKRPPLSALAVVSLVVAVTGYLNILGFIVGPVLAHIALVRLHIAKQHGMNVRGRRLAIAALWVSYGTLAVAFVTLIVVVIGAYAALPTPNFHVPHFF